MSGTMRLPRIKVYPVKIWPTIQSCVLADAATAVIGSAKRTKMVRNENPGG